ncbi:hypothetical protein LUQ84_3532 [Hamiltosporidium tvaerminnensis]|nr:hypothetical protein LUQ84_3532 [Hamiltosporidium tvaerminnensis]
MSTTFTENILSMDADAQEHRMLATTAEKLIKIYTIDNDQINPEFELKGHDGPVTSAKFINKGELIASCCFTGKVIIWKLEGNSYNKKFERKIFEGSLNSLSVKNIENGFIVFCACSDGNVRTLQFDFSLNYSEDLFFAHRFGVTCIDNNDLYVVTGGLDSNVTLWDLKEKKEIETFSDHKKFVRAVAVCPANEFNILTFASCAEDGSLVIYSREDDCIVKQIIEMGSPCYSVSWSASGFSLCVGYGDSFFKTFVPDVSGKFKEVEIVSNEK